MRSPRLLLFLLSISALAFIASACSQMPDINAVAQTKPKKPVEEWETMVPLVAAGNAEGLTDVSVIRTVDQLGSFSSSLPAGFSFERYMLVYLGKPKASSDASSLCRRLHALRDWTVALRTPLAPDHHPAPGEIALVREVLGHVGYWHDAARGGEAYLEVAGRDLLGASFDPLTEVDLAGLRDALPAAAPAVVACASGTARDEVVEALRCARGIFGN